LVVFISLIIKLVPLKKGKNCSIKSKDLGTKKSCYKLREQVKVSELIKS
jgi:hypothetical protein